MTPHDQAIIVHSLPYILTGCPTSQASPVINLFNNICSLPVLAEVIAT